MIVNAPLALVIVPFVVPTMEICAFANGVPDVLLDTTPLIVAPWARTTCGTLTVTISSATAGQRNDRPAARQLWCITAS